MTLLGMANNWADVSLYTGCAWYRERVSGGHSSCSTPFNTSTILQLKGSPSVVGSEYLNRFVSLSRMLSGSMGLVIEQKCYNAPSRCR